MPRAIRGLPFEISCVCGWRAGKARGGRKRLRSPRGNEVETGAFAMRTIVVRGEEIRMDAGVVIGPEMIDLPDFPYVYFWNRMGRKGQFCRVIARGKMNSCRVEFENGFQAITSRNALRKRAPRG